VPGHFDPLTYWRGSISVGSSFETLCQDLLPHWGHFINQRGCPAAFQRIPPRSQTDLANPHLHRTIHLRESASMLSPQLCGKIRRKNRWIADMRNADCFDELDPAFKDQ
jgi:hypothetical protein